jgi:hypothetical protein
MLRLRPEQICLNLQTAPLVSIPLIHDLPRAKLFIQEI